MPLADLSLTQLDQLSKVFFISCKAGHVIDKRVYDFYVYGISQIVAGFIGSLEPG